MLLKPRSDEIQEAEEKVAAGPGFCRGIMNG